MKTALLLPLTLVLLPLTQFVVALDPAQVPCLDPRGCPDLATDHPSLLVGTQRTENFSANHCAVQEGAVVPGARQLIRVSFTFGNIGRGDLDLGSPASHPDWFEWSPCHEHYHVKDHASFRIWTIGGFLAWDEYRKADPELTADEVLADHPELNGEFRAGKKQGFCIVSQELYPPGPNGAALTVDPIPEHSDILDGVCSWNQGQDPGWADTYAYFQDGMWVDVTGMATGAYILEGEMNSNHFIIETRYDNNRAAVPIDVVSQL